MKNYIGYIALGLAVISLVLVFTFRSDTLPTLQGTVENFPTWFINGLFGGTVNQFSVDKNGALTQGGSVYEITATSTTLFGSDLCALSVLDFANVSVAPAGITPTVTLPSATNTPCLKSPGTSKRFTIINNGGNNIALSGAQGGITFVNGTTTPGYSTIPPSWRASINIVMATSTSAVLYMIDLFR